MKICNELIEDDSPIEDDYLSILKNFYKNVDNFELKNILNGKDDSKDAIISIHPGAGGTESQDWANMLFRMYTRWIERKGFKKKILDYQQAEEAGIKDVSFEVSGDSVYGYLKSERGVH